MLLTRCVREYEKLLEKSTVLRHLQNNPLTRHYAIVGGAIRSWYLEETPRDIDIAVECHKDDLEEWANNLAVLGTVTVTKNRFGGLKVVDGSNGGIEFDIWAMCETEGLKNAAREGKCGSYTFQNLAQFAPWTTDCINLEITEEWPDPFHYASTRTIRLNDRGFIKALLTNTLDMNYDWTSNHPMKALRGLRTASKGLVGPAERRCLSVSDRAREYIIEHLDMRGKTASEVVSYLKAPLVREEANHDQAETLDYGPVLYVIDDDGKVADLAIPMFSDGKTSAYVGDWK